MNKKIAVLFLLMAVFLVQGCANKDMTQGMSHEEIITEAIANTYSAESVLIRSQAAYSTQSQVQPIDAEVIGETKIFAEPFMISNHYIVENRTIESKEEFKTYIHILDNQLMGYVFQNNEWFRAANLLDPDHLHTNPLNNLFLFLNNPSSSEFVIDDQQNNSMPETKKFILSADAGIYRTVLSQSLVSLDIAPYVISPEALEAMGDFTMAVWINKGSLQIQKIELDFTSNLNRLGAYLSQTEDVPNNVAELFETFNYKVTYTISDHNKLNPITVPLEARVGTKLD